MKAVAGVLGNTPAVCRKAYIDPAILEAYEAGALSLKASASDRAFELAVLKFLERARRVWSGTGERQSVAFIDLLLAFPALFVGAQQGDRGPARLWRGTRRVPRA